MNTIEQIGKPIDLPKEGSAPKTSESENKETAKATEAENKETENEIDEQDNEMYLPFPTHFLPFDFKCLVESYAAYSHKSQAFIANGLWGVIGGLVGNSITLDYRGITQPLIFWNCSVGRSQSGKTKGFSVWLGKYLQQKQGKLQDEYNLAMQEYSANPLDIKEPKLSVIYTNSGTVEGVTQTLEHNTGLLFWANELVNWIEGFNKYNNGSGDETAYLNLWEGLGTMLTNKAKTTFVKPASLSIFGTTQPNKVRSFAKKGRDESGFFYRILWAFGEELPPTTEYIPINPAYIDVLYAGLDRLLELRKQEPVCLTFSSEAVSEFEDFEFKKKTEYFKSLDCLKSLNGAMLGYIQRFALAIELMKWCFTKEDTLLPKQISLDSLVKAIGFYDYYMANGLKALGIVGNYDPLQGLSEAQRYLVNHLPSNKEFTTGEAVKIGTTNKLLSEKTVRDFLKNNRFFIKVSHGIFKKK
jgi:Protein of unknown function (DUF3987)